MIQLTRSALVNLWEEGILSDVAYVWFALSWEFQTHGTQVNLDCHDFSLRWQGVPNEDGRVKSLGAEKVKKALLMLESKGLVRPCNGLLSFEVSFSDGLSVLEREDG